MKRLLMAMLVLLVSSTAWSAEQFGITVFPGASENAEATKLAKLPGGNAACYKTNTPLAEVVTFYKNQPGLEPFAPPKGMQMAATVFQKGQSIQVRIQSKPADPKETDFCIAKAD